MWRLKQDIHALLRCSYSIFIDMTMAICLTCFQSLDSRLERWCIACSLWLLKQGPKYFQGNQS